MKHTKLQVVKLLTEYLDNIPHDTELQIHKIIESSSIPLKDKLPKIIKALVKGERDYIAKRVETLRVN